MARPLQLIIKQPGTLLSKLAEIDITPEQYAAIMCIAEKPDDYILIKRDLVAGPKASRMGFVPPEESR